VERAQYKEQDGKRVGSIRAELGDGERPVRDKNKQLQDEARHEQDDRQSKEEKHGHRRVDEKQDYSHLPNEIRVVIGKSRILKR